MACTCEFLADLATHSAISQTKILLWYCLDYMARHDDPHHRMCLLKAIVAGLTALEVEADVIVTDLADAVEGGEAVVDGKVVGDDESKQGLPVARRLLSKDPLEPNEVQQRTSEDLYGQVVETLGHFLLQTEETAFRKMALSAFKRLWVLQKPASPLQAAILKALAAKLIRDNDNVPLTLESSDGPPFVISPGGNPKLFSPTPPASPHEGGEVPAHFE